MQTATSAAYRQDLGNGLILRWSTAEDTEKIAELTSHVFRDKATDPPNEYLANAVRRLMRGDHPLMGPGDFGVVEDTLKEGHPIVACTCLERMQWQYEGIHFVTGRPEIVASHPDYRNSGLIRSLFEMVHARSEGEGHPVQAITGISYFYRQFGYEYALNLGGRRTTYLPLIPKLKEGETEPFTLREATIEDIPQLQDFYSQRQSQSIVWNFRPERYWQYWLDGLKQDHSLGETSVIMVIVDTSGKAQGYLATSRKRWWRGLNVWDLEAGAGVNWQALMPSLLRALQAYGQPLPTAKPDTEPFSEISFDLGHSHPAYDALGNGMAPYKETPYAWYVRVPNLPEFIKLIAPALEKRLQNSPVAGFSGELKLNFYRGGLRIVFEQGRLTTAEHWKAPIYEANASAGFPPLVFLQVLFGHRSIDELRHIFPDVWVSNELEIVLKTLFPTRPSYVPEF